MPYQIENLTMRPVLLSLTTGETLRLAPRETSSAFRDVEVKNNPNIQKLQGQRVISLHEMQGQKEAPVPAEIEEGKESPSGSARKKQNPPSETVTNQP
jgi:hypothetical protein